MTNRYKWTILILSFSVLILSISSNRKWKRIEMLEKHQLHQDSVTIKCLKNDILMLDMFNEHLIIEIIKLKADSINAHR